MTTALAIDKVFLAQSFEPGGSYSRFVQSTAPTSLLILTARFIAAVIDNQPHYQWVLLLSPVLGRAMDPDRMLLGRPRETLREAIGEATRPSFSLLIMTGRNEIWLGTTHYSGNV